jgi:hypothetical protein
MTLKNLIFLCFLVPLVAFAAKPQVTEEIEIPPTVVVNPVSLTVEQQVEYFSKLYGADVSLVKKVIECESGWEHDSSADGNRSNGILQFQESTFNRMGKMFGEELDYHSQFDQIKLGTWALSKPELAREWTTWVSIQRGGKYSFYSKQLQKHFVVYCKLN